MDIIVKEAFESGGYPPIQSWDSLTIPETHAVVPSTLDTAVFYEYNGFVFLTIEEIEGVDTVTAIKANVEAWEAWKATLTPVEPTEKYSADDVLKTLLGVS